MKLTQTQIEKLGLSDKRPAPAKKPSLSPEQLEKLAQLVDMTDNYLAFRVNPFMSLNMKAEAYEHGLTEMRDAVMQLYLDCGGENVWGGMTGPAPHKNQEGNTRKGKA